MQLNFDVKILNFHVLMLNPNLYVKYSDVFFIFFTTFVGGSCRAGTIAPISPRDKICCSYPL